VGLLLISGYNLFVAKLD